jgi:high-affinity Fe2+/Pb2+ permease
MRDMIRALCVLGLIGCACAAPASITIYRRLGDLAQTQHFVAVWGVILLIAILLLASLRRLHRHDS